MKFNVIFLVFGLLVSLLTLTSCSPEVGSEDWCHDLRNKAKLDWTAAETAAYTKFCFLKK